MDVFKEHAKIPGVLWKQYEMMDVVLTGNEALDYGIATEIGEFVIPPRARFFDFLTGF